MGLFFLLTFVIASFINVEEGVTDCTCEPTNKCVLEEKEVDGWTLVTILGAVIGREDHADNANW